jgi:hypothetical protein
VQCAEVEAFAAANPDLAEELELLNATRLPDELLTLEDKSDLFSHNIRTGIVDESLLLAIDNELPEDEQQALEVRINKDEDLALHYNLLKRVKLDAAETLVYPHKKELYRHEQRTIPAYWMQVAAAVVLLLTIAAFWIISSNSPAPPPVAKTPDVVPTLQNHSERLPERSLAIEQDQPEPVPVEVAKNSAQKRAPQVRKEQAPSSDIAGNIQKAPAPKSPSFNGVPDDRDRVIASVELPEQTKPSIEKSGAIEVPLTQQTFNTPSVTTGKPSPYTSIDAPVTDAGVSFAVASDNIDKKGSVRGFLRKATRFIERRTGINPVNEDERLLVGVVAIKL